MNATREISPQDISRAMLRARTERSRAFHRLLSLLFARQPAQPHRDALATCGA